MVDCDLQLELNRENRSYDSSDEVMGYIHVEPYEQSENIELHAKLKWNVYSNDALFEHTADEQILYDGSWDGQKNHSYAFSLDLSSGPYSYYGNGLRVDWIIKAELYRDGEIQKETRRQITLEPDPLDRVFNPGVQNEVPDKFRHRNSSTLAESWYERFDLTKRKAKYLESRLALTASVVSAGLMIFVLIYAITNPAAIQQWLSSKPRLITTLLGGVGLLGLFFYAVSITVNDFNELRNDIILRTPRLEVDRNTVAPGETLSMTFVLPAHFDKPRSITGKLLGNEKVVTEEEEDILEHDRWEIENVVKQKSPESGEYLKGEHAYKYTFSFTLPEDAPFSLFAPRHFVSWEVDLVSDFGPDEQWNNSKTILVKPKGTKVKI